MLYSYLLEDPLMSCGLTTQKLYRPHKSHHNNPLLAEPMHWCGYIEKAGTGTGDIVRLCAEYGLKDPKFEQDNDFKATIWRAVAEQVAEQVTEQVTEQVIGLLNILDSPKLVKKILECLGMKHRPTLYSIYITPAMDMGLIEMSEPDSPNSPRQKYRITKKGESIKNVVK